MKLILAGATGLVGGHVLGLALADDRVDSLIAPVRRPLPPHPKLTAPVVDFDRLPITADWWAADAVICALGTTMAAAGSQASFRKVDYDYQRAVADLARQHGTAVFVLNSARGANPAARIFYSRVKGELERDISAIGFRSVTIVRPGLIGGKRNNPRLVEQLGAAILGALHPALPKSLRINPAPKIAQVMLDAAIAAPDGVRIVPAADMN